MQTFIDYIQAVLSLCVGPAQITILCRSTGESATPEESCKSLKKFCATLSMEVVCEGRGWKGNEYNNIYDLEGV